MPEGNFGKVASPAHGDADPEQGGTEDIAEGLPQVETLEGKLPDTLKGLGVVGLSKNLVV